MAARKPKTPPMDEAHIFVTADPSVIGIVEQHAIDWPKWIRARRRVLNKIAPPLPEGSTVKKRVPLFRGRLATGFAGFEAVGDEVWNGGCREPGRKPRPSEASQPTRPPAKGPVRS